MKLKIDGKKVTIPFLPEEVTINQFLEFQRLHADLITETSYREPDLEEWEKEFQFQLHLERLSAAWASFFAGMELYGSIGHDIAQLLASEYAVFIDIINSSLKEPVTNYTATWKDETWEIQDFVVDPASGMTFNEVITSKEVMRQLYSLGKGKWDSLPYLACIFLRKKDEPFTDDLILEGSERMELMQRLPLNHALALAAWYDQLCRYLAENFSVFGSRGGGDTKPELVAHYENWGWVSFLSSVAESKVFDIPGSGLDSFKCAGKAKAYEVLTYASEKRDLDIAMKEAYKS
ncbi:MAG: hypothetical protein KIT80_16090 [Chitinophagaceae bacterium]|nr:hypothetical protein [Chitinophagaceae bacterium]MCW5928437.1 hypothetical protein [Chitinophagaceae bacterium]